MVNFFIYCIKKMKFFKLTEEYLPPTTSVRTMIKKTSLQWKPMELGGVLKKMDEPSLGFHGLSRLVSKIIFFWCPPKWSISMKYV